ncbi:breast cancer anti-estrogen resistance protein 3 homolog isoform X3 [Salmo salar]|uniref:Breast cancer anti-estrogen resistance protein 3 homolog isoform X3 n=1 Tax=Salmo salar TaxID=8030 RepID=A0ABM3CJ90_SALSA|nr:breast cancer anti-estrogen resistance protein 3 homolog isoform X3 [Salmo salar]
MNNRSIAWWLKQIGLPQYTKSLEREYYGLEGLLYVCDVDLKEAGVDDPSHRDTILSQLLRHRQTLDPHSGMVEELRVSRKYSLGSSLDLVKPRKDLFRQSVLPRLRRKVTVSASCSQLHPLEEGLSPGLAPEQTRKRSKRRSVTAYLSQLKVFGGSREMDSLKKELEEELKLSADDLRSHAWYHGPIGREGAEALLERDGDFMVRDTASSPGDYVLSCYWRDEPLHFKIIRVVLRPKKGYSRELFQFEGDRFDNIPALVRFHVGGRHPVSQATGAVVYHPITRSLPIRVISERQAERTDSNRSSNRSSNSAPDRVGVESQPDRSKRLSFNSSHMDTLHVTNTLSRSGSQPANLENLGRRPSIQSAQSESNLRTGAPHSCQSEAVGPAPISPVFRTGSEPLISPSALRHTRPSHPGGGVTLRGSDGQLHPRAPPKPFRVSTFFPGTPPNRHRDDPYDELVIQVPESKKRGHVDRLRAEEKWQSRARLTETSFSFLEAQESGELPRLPIDGQVQEEEEDSHFQRPQVAHIVGVTEDQKRMMGVGSGLELVTLSHGQQLRQDLLERHHLLALGVAIDILGCTGTVGQRATVLHKVILLAQALRDHAHNLYAFSAVMKALEMPQVVRLERTWRALRRNHTESAVMFEKTLKPFMNALNDGDGEEDSVVQGPLAVPHLVPLLRLMEGEEGEHTERGCQLLYNTLQAARNAALHAPQYQEHAHSLLTGDWKPIPELLECFRTEFALRLFWGQTGAAADKEKRYDKFDKILTVLSNKLEPSEEFSPEL